MLSHSEKILKPAAFFVHLTFFGFLRGCMAGLESVKKAYKEPRENALRPPACPLGCKFAILEKDSING